MSLNSSPPNKLLSREADETEFLKCTDCGAMHVMLINAITVRSLGSVDGRGVDQFQNWVDRESQRGCNIAGFVWLTVPCRWAALKRKVGHHRNWLISPARGGKTSAHHVKIHWKQRRRDVYIKRRQWHLDSLICRLCDRLTGNWFSFNMSVWENAPRIMPCSLPQYFAELISITLPLTCAPWIGYGRSQVQHIGRFRVHDCACASELFRQLVVAVASWKISFGAEHGIGKSSYFAFSWHWR